MASFAHYEGLFKNPGVRVVAGTFVCNGASAPTTTTGNGWSVAAPSTGVYTVTLDEAYPGLIACIVTLEQGAGGNDDAKLTASDVDASGGGTLTIETQSVDGTAANLASGTVHFVCLLRNTAITK